MYSRFQCIFPVLLFLKKVVSLFVVVIGFVCCFFFFTSIKRRYSLQLLFSLKTGTQKEKFKSPSYQIKVIAHNSMFSFCKDIMDYGKGRAQFFRPSGGICI